MIYPRKAHIYSDVLYFFHLCQQIFHPFSPGPSLRRQKRRAPRLRKRHRRPRRRRWRAATRGAGGGLQLAALGGQRGELGIEVIVVSTIVIIIVMVIVMQCVIQKLLW